MLKYLYPVEQLRVRPSQIQIDLDDPLPGAFSDFEQDAMIALLIILMCENGDEWMGIPVADLGDRVLAEQRKVQQGEVNRMAVFGTYPHATYRNGINKLIERDVIKVEWRSETDDMGAFDLEVAFPTPKLLNCIEQFIRY